MYTPPCDGVSLVASAAILPQPCRRLERPAIGTRPRSQKHEIIAGMRHSLYKYFPEHKWADAFLDGEVLFRSLAYFRDQEDKNVRQDKKEGTAVFRPTGGLLIDNLTQGTTFRLPDSAFESTANQEEIFVFCASRSLTDELRKRFEAVVCVEILKIPKLCERIRRALPADATFRAGRVAYYDQGEGGSPRWALPDQIAMSKLESYRWQDEFRLMFCLTEALGFEKGALRLVKGDAIQAPESAEHHEYPVKTRSLRDICRLHEF